MRHIAFALTAFLAACAGQDSHEQPTGAGGKADDPFACPVQVTLNNASGSQRRCVDADSGQFVATDCCADVCSGAGWQSQANGERCRWLDGPGQPGAEIGQFAPSMCCALNDRLACKGASLVGGQCESTGGDAVESVCCQQAPITCHPMVEAQLRSCVEAVVLDFADDPDALPISKYEALVFCVNEGDLRGPMLDTLCESDPDGFCNLDFESFALDFVAACGQEIASEFSCAFGQTFGELLERPNLVITEDLRIDHAEAVQSLSTSEGAQVITALHQSSHTDVASLAEAFAAMDQGELRVVRVLETTLGRAYHAFEYGAGDNSYGAIFDTATGVLAARIIDGDIYDGSALAKPGCDITTTSEPTPTL